MDSTFAFGLVECIASTVLYGSAFVPIKKRKFGDGIYSLQIRSIAILIVGLVTYIWSGYPPFYPLAMVGGMLWAIANLIVLPCIAQLGLGMTVLLYSTTNCLLIGSPKHIFELNVSVCIFELQKLCFATKSFRNAEQLRLIWHHSTTSEHPLAELPRTSIFTGWVRTLTISARGILIAFIKPEAQKQAKKSSESVIGIVSEKRESVQIDGFVPPVTISTSSLKKFGIKRVVAIVFALISGFFYGEDVTPVITVQDSIKGAPQDGLSYCFAHYMGIFVTASLVMVAYCGVKKNKPYINDELTLPSFVSGLIWGVAQTLFMISIKHLSQSVCGAIGAILPAFFATLWAVFWFKEIKGRNNYIFLICALLAMTTGSTLIALSKIL
ncbi:hypothetical protein M3Y97_00753200 [Aphelenchoides bicaudatus]|nr:hypothetical protein M3Y97_00753200 [Aphelenchoides bicaudatus]